MSRIHLRLVQIIISHSHTARGEGDVINGDVAHLLGPDRGLPHQPVRCLGPAGGDDAGGGVHPPRYCGCVDCRYPLDMQWTHLLRSIPSWSTPSPACCHTWVRSNTSPPWVLHIGHRLQLGSKYFLLIKYFLFCKIFLLLVEIFLVPFLTLLRQGREGDF